MKWIVLLMALALSTIFVSMNNIFKLLLFCIITGLLSSCFLTSKNFKNILLNIFICTIFLFPLRLQYDPGSDFDVISSFFLVPLIPFLTFIFIEYRCDLEIKRTIKKEMLKKHQIEEVYENRKQVFQHILSNSCNFLQIENISQDKIYELNNIVDYNLKETPKVWLTSHEQEIWIENTLKQFQEINEKLNIIKKVDNKLMYQDPIKYNDKITYYRSEDDLKKLAKLKIINKRLEEFSIMFNKRFAYYYNLLDNLKIGRQGEEEVINYLSQFDNYVVLSNVRLEVMDNQDKIQSVESDVILLTHRGIFVIEIKNLGSKGGYSLIIEKDGRWLKKFSNGKTEVMNNATQQNNRHMIYINKLLNTEIHRNFDNLLECEGIVIISNNKLNIENNSQNQNVFRLEEIYNFIRNKPIMFTSEDINTVKEVLISNNKEAQKFPLYDYSGEIANNYQCLTEIMNLIDTEIKSFTFDETESEVVPQLIIKDNVIIDKNIFEPEIRVLNNQ